MNSTDFLQHLVRELAGLSRETQWVEFKENNANPEEIGEYVSAIANSAALEGKQRGYIVWGVRDADHQIVGTTFKAAVCTTGEWERAILAAYDIWKQLQQNQGGKVALDLDKATITYAGL